LLRPAANQGSPAFDFTTGVTIPEGCPLYCKAVDVVFPDIWFMLLSLLCCLIIAAAVLPVTRGGVYTEELTPPCERDDDDPCPSGLCGMVDYISIAVSLIALLRNCVIDRIALVSFTTAIICQQDVVMMR